ncbi:hypothetical protein C474_06432 [Halogeometricum pallidum JCM 14848]|uniref:ArsR family transcriptional regulator n=1 Tax=Halogeometricum pallidum JCM 14848 TaxID=1227487 RepID=M0DCA6_HALPD|nr:hypothetical protein C474_06432 [Halogeometricum pallidum JCM 14848]
MGENPEKSIDEGAPKEGSGLSFSETVATAIASLASETRLRILLVLWDAQDRPLRFGELRKRVGVADPGQFRYHLRKLEDQFVRNTAEGYDITNAGVNVVWAVRSGDLTWSGDVDPFPIDSVCPACSAGLSLRYEEQMFFVICPDCGRTHEMAPFHPSGLVGRTNREIHAAFERVSHGQFELGAHDICPRCYGTGSFTLVTDENAVPTDLREELSAAELADLTRYDLQEGIASVVWTCSQCGLWMEFPLAVLLCHRTAVAEFYRDHGVDVDAVPARDLPNHLGDVAITVTELDPLSMLVTMTKDDETLTVSIDGGFAGVATERTPADYGSPAS